MNVKKSIYFNSMVICMEEMKLIGRRIKTLRMSKGVSQLELAEAIGMSQTNLSNVESGRTASTIQVLLKIRKVLNCKLADFFADIDNAQENDSKVEVPKSIELEDAVKILKLLKAVDIKGL